MYEGQADGTGTGVADDEAKAALDDLLADPEFHATPRQKEFLRYVATELFEGRGEAIKAYSIAIDAFGRSKSFNPTYDPIVRIEATRLRAALARYHEGVGRHRQIRVDLAKGRYIPTFVRLAPRPAPALPAAEEPRLSGRRPLRIPGRGLLTLSLGAFVTAAAAFFLFPGRSGDAISERPTVILEFAPGTASDAERAQLGQHLVDALSRFPTLQVGTSSPDTTPESSGGNRYRVILTYGRQAGGREVQWGVVSAGGELLQTGVLPAYEAGPSLETLVSRLSARLAGYRGAIPSMETRWQLDHPSLGAGCVQRAIFAVAERLDATELEKARICLEATIRVQPGNADARAALAYVLVAERPFEMSEGTVRQALDAARTAVSLSPDSNRARAALMVALYHSRQTQAAIVEGRRSVELNPNESVIQAYLGWLLFATGQYEEGVRLANTAIDTDPLAYYDSGTTLVLDDYRRGAFESALARFAERPYKQPYMVMLTRIASLAELGRHDDAARATGELRAVRPAFEKSFCNDMEARSILPALRERLAASLEKAGLQVCSSESE